MTLPAAAVVVAVEPDAVAGQVVVVELREAAVLRLPVNASSIILDLR